METITRSNIGQSQSNGGFAGFFKQVQDAPWYQMFLNPAIHELETLPPGSKVLDVGTGAGRFIELAQNQLSLSFVGIDTDEAMLAQARTRPALANVPLRMVKPDQPLPFGEEFDAISLCSVLFLLEDPLALLEEALRVLKPDGKIVVLTPSTHGNARDAIRVLSQVDFTVSNWTFFLWRRMTRSGARRWELANTLVEFAERSRSTYTRRLIFSDFAVVEVLRKNRSHFANS